MKRKLTASLLAALACGCASQASEPWPSTGPLPEVRSADIGYPTPADALAALRAKPNTIVRVEQGWVIVEDRADPEGFALWSFPPETHNAYPSAVKRVTYEKDGGVWITMAISCGASKAACDSLARDFEALNERMKQSMQRRR
jgi:hypothetical protein